LIKTLWTIGLTLLVAAALSACGGGGDSSESSGVNDGANDVAQNDPPPAPADTPPATDPSGDAPAGDTPTVPPEKYATTYDANAVYTLDDINMSGSYLKISFDGLTPDQVNRAIHRLRTELCTCGCENDPIDQCLINDPTCPTAPTLAKQIIREEQTKG